MVNRSSAEREPEAGQGRAEREPGTGAHGPWGVFYLGSSPPVQQAVPQEYPGTVRQGERGDLLLGVKPPVQEVVRLVGVAGAPHVGAAEAGVCGVAQVVPGPDVPGAEADGAELGREGEALGQAGCRVVVAAMEG